MSDAACYVPRFEEENGTSSTLVERGKETIRDASRNELS